MTEWFIYLTVQAIAFHCSEAEEPLVSSSHVSHQRNAVMPASWRCFRSQVTRRNLWFGRGRESLSGPRVNRKLSSPRLNFRRERKSEKMSNFEDTPLESSFLHLVY